jgi:hypothetical protein
MPFTENNSSSRALSDRCRHDAEQDETVLLLQEPIRKRVLEVKSPLCLSQTSFGPSQVIISRPFQWLVQ